MAKFLNAKTLDISILNYAFGSQCIQMITPLSYSLYDLIQIIKMWTNYTNTYDWTFRNPYEEDSDLSLLNDLDKIKSISFWEYRNITPSIVCNYGPIEIGLGLRGHVKYGKVYPTIYQAVGYFPTEEEFLRKIKSLDIDGQYTIPGKKSPSASHRINTDLIELGEKLKEYFKKKYKISNEIVEDSYNNENKLIRI